ncbi:MAG: hypothetical protein KDA78_00070 [Planctomycetaceae bacterium]|nr:hypothetical protein [Planctomycetaceae bacterium]
MSAPEPALEIPTLRLKPDISRPLAVFVFSILFLGIGFDIVNQGNHAGWLLIVLFGLAIIASLSSLLPGASYVEINESGITIASSFRLRTYRWQEVERMGVFEIGMIRRVGVDLNKTYRGPERVPDYMKPPSGYHIALPNMGGMEPEKVLEVMQECFRVTRLRA